MHARSTTDLSSILLRAPVYVNAGGMLLQSIFRAALISSELSDWEVRLTYLLRRLRQLSSGGGVIFTSFASAAA